MSHSQPSSPAGPSGQPASNPWAVLMVMCLGVFMLLIDTTIVNVAQVKIKESLGASLTEIQWILDSYILTYAVLLLSFGRLGDIYGRKRLFILGLSIFTAASALCGASVWIGDLLGVSAVYVLIFSRILQGVGGAFMMPQSLSLVTVTFPPEKRGAALGMWGSVVALGAILGPIIGGLIVTDYAWEWIFLINVPVGILAVFATVKLVPESSDPLAGKRLDWGGTLLSGLGIFALVFAFIEGPNFGWTDPIILALFVSSAVLLMLFIWWEKRVSDPIVKLELFRLRNFTVGNVIAIVIAFGMLGIFFPLTLFLQQGLGYSPIKAGLTTTPMSVMILLSAPIAGRMTDRFGARWILFTGTGLMTTGILFLNARIDLDTTPLALLPPLAVMGLGMGMTFSPMTAATMREVPLRIAGSASGILNTMRNIGQVLGIAVLGSFLRNRLETHTASEIAPLGLPASMADQVAQLASETQFSAITDLVPVEAVAGVMAGVQRAFVESIHNTFFLAAVTCAAAAGVALLIRNPGVRPVRVDQAAPERTELAAAD